MNWHAYGYDARTLARRALLRRNLTKMLEQPTLLGPTKLSGCLIE